MKVEQEKINVKVEVIASVGGGGDKIWNETTKAYENADYTWDSSEDSLQVNVPTGKASVAQTNIVVKI